MSEFTTNRGYEVPTSDDAFEPQRWINSLGDAIDADMVAVTANAVEVTNRTGTTINAGVLVAFAGIQGDVPKVAPFDPATMSPKLVLGITMESIADNANGNVATAGIVDGLTTNTYPLDAPLYAHPTTPGALTSTEPTSGVKLPVAVVVRSGPGSSGSLLVWVKPGFTIEDLSGVENPSTGEALVKQADGTYAGVAHVDGGANTVKIGNGAGAGGLGDSAVAIGRDAQRNGTGNLTVAIGRSAQQNGAGYGATALGDKAQEFTSGNGTLAVGKSAQYAASSPLSTAVGYYAQSLASGTSSTAVGTFAQNYAVISSGVNSFAGPLVAGRRYLITGTNVQIDSVPPPQGGYVATGTETTITADANLRIQIEMVDVDFHTIVGANSGAEYPGGIAIGAGAYADVDRQVQIGTDQRVPNLADYDPPNALRVGVHDAILTTDTPTTGEVLRFDGSAWVADGAATAAQGALADSAVQPGDLQSLADAVDADVEALESRTITAGTGLTGGGDLSANRTLSVDTGGIDTAQLADGAVTQAKSSLGLGFGLGARPTSSRYLTLPGASVASFTAAWERIYMMPLHLWAGTLTRIGIEVVTGQPSAQVRLGIYAARDTDGRPIPAVDPLLDAGAVDASTSGIKEITISHTVTTSGWVYLAAFVYGGSGTGIDLYGLSGAPITPITTVHSLVYGTGTTSALIAFNRPDETSLVQLNEFPSFGHLIPRIVVRY